VGFFFKKNVFLEDQKNMVHAVHLTARAAGSAVRSA
jgi:hypothetical protein